MNPIKFSAGALRRLCLSASSDLLHRPHLCALRFRPSDVVATNGAMLVRAPLPHDAERDFVLPAFPVQRLIGKHRHRTVKVTRCERETRIEIEGVLHLSPVADAVAPQTGWRETFDQTKGQ